MLALILRLHSCREKASSIPRSPWSLPAQNCTNLARSWRHPLSRTDSWSPDYYREIGRVLEAGKFHLGFFDDRLAMPDSYGRNHAHTWSTASAA